MEYFWKQHQRFMKASYQSCKFGNDPYSVLPSVIFTCGTFCLLYFYLRPFPCLTWSRSLYKNMMFHWIFFYVFRMWLLYVKFVKYSTFVLDKILKGSLPDRGFVLSSALVHALSFLTALTISVMPLLFLRLFIMYTRTMAIVVEWEEQEPWESNEIGSAGRYLIRPPDVDRRSRKSRRAYRSKRSMSFDDRSELRGEELAIRSCKSLTDIPSWHDLGGSD